MALIDGHRLIKQYADKNDLLKQDKKSIISIAVNHLRLCTEKEPSARDKKIWAQVLVNMFPALRDESSEENYVSIIKMFI